VNAPKSSKPGQLLVVDDNEMNRDVMSRRLRREGYAVDVAEDGYRAMEMIRKTKYDLILLDVMMPGLSGFEMLPMIRQQYDMTDLPVIMATAKDQSEDIVEGLRLGANDYVTKPIDHPVLLARIQLHLKLKNLSQLKDEFIRIASHDLKNPLSTVMMAAHIVRDRVPPGTTMQDQFYQMLLFIVKHSEEMQRIIRDFLDFQAMEDGALALTRVPMNLNTLAQELHAENSDYALNKIQLVIQTAPQLPEIQGDADRVKQVGQNLVGNAIKFSPLNASVTIRTRQENGHLLFEVSDTGPGLQPDDFPKLFSKYARLSNKPTGEEKSTGLGLAICKQMIELHGGTIGAHNNPDRGATFWFKLPVN
jgi:two-component system, sensor histidine kinase and response regulator